MTASQFLQMFLFSPNQQYDFVGKLSGGERQRIGIARALYRQPDILFFDEATSALDKETESSVNHAIESLSTNNIELTIVVIAHRETSLGYCDRIINIG